MNLIPLTIALALSMRTPKIEDKPTDVQLSLGSSWQLLEAEIECERENGQWYLDYFVAIEDTIYGSWLIEASSRVKGAIEIDYQSLIIGYDGLIVNLGGGLVTHKYKIPVKAVYSFRFPLPGGGLKFMTDFKHVHIWKGSAFYYFADDEDEIRPYVEYVGTADNGKTNYLVKLGMEVIL